jgi:hypothetical protein
MNSEEDLALIHELVALIQGLQLELRAMRQLLIEHGVLSAAEIDGRLERDRVMPRK